MTYDPRKHPANCAYHVDQYPWECTCGLIAQVGRNPSGPRREAGSVRKHEHAVPEGDAPEQSETHP